LYKCSSKDKLKQKNTPFWILLYQTSQTYIVKIIILST